MLRSGLTGKEISRLLHIAPGSADWHRYNRYNIERVLFHFVWIRGHILPPYLLIVGVPRLPDGQGFIEPASKRA